MSTDLNLPTDAISKALLVALKEHLNGQFEVLKKKLVEDLDKEKDIIISGLALNLMKQVRYDMRQNELVITINTQTFKEKTQ
jgi:hypothetical protein